MEPVDRHLSVGRCFVDAAQECRRHVADDDPEDLLWRSLVCPQKLRKLLQRLLVFAGRRKQYRLFAPLHDEYGDVVVPALANSFCSDATEIQGGFGFT